MAIFQLTLCLCLSLFIKNAFSTRCYQCSSKNSKDESTEDHCGAYKPFDTLQNQPVDCNGDESVTPGTFCVKIVKQGPIGFIWDGRWRQVIRRCASVSETGVTGVCNWGIYWNMDYWEECYCSEDSCNSSSQIKSVKVLLTLAILLLLSSFQKINIFWL